MIAADETRHAELAWAIMTWCLDAGGDEVLAAVATRATRLGDELAPRVPDLPGIAPERLASYGLLDQETIGAVAAARIAATRARAAALDTRARAA